MLNRRHFIGSILALPALALGTRPVWAMQPEIHAPQGLAIGGYDPVAYFSGTPTRGDPAHFLMWRGAEWRFASAGAMEAFEMNPTAHAPRYGGYCAYALAQGALAATDPLAWTIEQGQLYLNYSLDVRVIWAQDIPGNIARADANWPAILG